ncbi:hypothetical protein SAMN04487972_1252 [Paracoccus halophilus]|uniref:Uncharacterized protein n=1 Tax=Paracoccus halophilus TaxID=376733 RepID=A0A1I0U774_9RHOB|nr:hypothetical protein SAMN04487972_1252 [Paracoccus halophilus]
MVTFVEAAFGINENIRDVLHITDFPFTLPHFQKRVVSCRVHIGRIEQQDAAMTGPETCGQIPVLALDVMDNATSRPGQQRRHDEAHALAGSGWRKAQHMLGAVMTKIILAVPPQHDAIGAEQSGRMDFLILGPSRRTVGGNIAGFPCPDDRHEEGGSYGKNRPGRGDERAFGKDAGRIGVIGKPPPEEGRWIIERPSRNIEPGIAELWLEAEPESHPLRCSPDHHHDDGEDDNDLAPEYSPSTHIDSNRQKRRSRSENGRFREVQQPRCGHRAAEYYRRQIGWVTAALFRHRSRWTIANQTSALCGPSVSPA